MNIVYLITDSFTNLKYLGSKKDWKGEGTYFGSPSIKSKNHPKYDMQKKWKIDTKERPESFVFSILEKIEDPLLLNERELHFQIINDVVNSTEFINGAYARKNFYRNKGSKWDKDRLIELKKLGTWKTTEEQKKKISIKQSGKKYTSEINKKKGRSGEKNGNSRSVIIDEKIYSTVYSASVELGVDRHTIINRIKKLNNYNYV